MASFAKKVSHAALWLATTAIAGVACVVEPGEETHAVAQAVTPVPTIPQCNSGDGGVGDAGLDGVLADYPGGLGYTGYGYGGYGLGSYGYGLGGYGYGLGSYGYGLGNYGLGSYYGGSYGRGYGAGYLGGYGYGPSYGGWGGYDGLEYGESWPTLPNPYLDGGCQN